MQQSQIFGYNRLLVRYRFYLALRGPHHISTTALDAAF